MKRMESKKVLAIMCFILSFAFQLSAKEKIIESLWTDSPLKIDGSVNEWKDDPLSVKKKALELQPDFVDVYFNLGITYLQAGYKSQALRVLNRCKEKFYNRLPSSEQDRLNRLIAEASR